METINWSLDHIVNTKSAAERENMFGKLKCRYKGHILTQAGTCPYTGSTYDYCERCSNMIPREIAA
jgi:hypothetical protein